MDPDPNADAGSGWRSGIRGPTPACAGAELLTGGLRVRVLPEELRPPGGARQGFPHALTINAGVTLFVIGLTEISAHLTGLSRLGLPLCGTGAARR